MYLVGVVKEERKIKTEKKKFFGDDKAEQNDPQMDRMQNSLSLTLCPREGCWRKLS